MYEKWSVSNEHVVNQRNFRKGHVCIASNSDMLDHESSVRRCVVIGRRDGA